MDCVLHNVISYETGSGCPPKDSLHENVMSNVILPHPRFHLDKSRVLHMKFDMSIDMLAVL